MILLDDCSTDESAAGWVPEMLSTRIQLLSGHPKPANDKTRDIDSDERAYSLRQHEQCLERREETTSHRTGEARVALVAHRASHGCTS
jgi:hypothetical protein